jgi:hypothetical protein
VPDPLGVAVGYKLSAIGKKGKLLAHSLWPTAYSSLVAIPAEGCGNDLAVAVGRGGGSTQVPLALVRHAGSQMASARLAMLGLSRGGQPEPFLGSLVSLLLWHGITPFRIALFGEQ